MPWLPPTIEQWHGDLDEVAAEATPTFFAIVVLVEDGGKYPRENLSGALGMQILPLAGAPGALRPRRQAPLRPWATSTSARCLGVQLAAFATPRSARSTSRPRRSLRNR